jgi:hypothetical protein
MLLAIPILGYMSLRCSRASIADHHHLPGEGSSFTPINAQGLSNEAPLFALWGSSLFVGCALTVYTWNVQVGTAVIAATGLIWLVAFVWFWRIPSTD